MTPREELEAAIEAILFVATEPVAAERLHALFVDDDRESVEAALQAVIARYPGGAAQGLVADFAAGGVRLVTRPALQGWLRKFFQVTGRTKLSMAALETLAIIAYRQPITGPEIQELRGVSSASVLNTLLEHHLVRISGRKEVVGKPFLYSTSREFLIRFGLNRLQDLPPLEELEQMLQAQVAAEGDTLLQQPLDLRAGGDEAEAELARAERGEVGRESREEEVTAEDLAADDVPRDFDAGPIDGEPGSEELAPFASGTTGAFDPVDGDADLEWPEGEAEGELDEVSEREIEATLAASDWGDDDDLPEEE
jgi:segregation and condensation protein B